MSESEDAVSQLNKLIKQVQKTDLLITPRYEEYLISAREILVTDEIAQLVIHEIATPQRDRTNTISASSLGSCPRQQVFKFTPLTPRVALSDAHAYFHDGHFRHLKWQTLMLDAGLLTDVEISVQLPEYNLTGTIDGLNRDEGFGWELKGINSRGYRYLHEGGPKPQHLKQVTAYMMATDIDPWSLVYENKDTNEWKEFVIYLTHDLVDAVETELKTINTHLAEQTLPPVLEECKQGKGPFRQCAYAHKCLTQKGWPQKGITL